MPFYTKPIAQLDASDLQELLDEPAIENVRLEFTSKEENKAETLKKLSSFANTFGGYLLVGGIADSKDGRLQSLPGIGTLPSYGQQILAWCFQGASPPITAEVSGPIPAPGTGGGVRYVIYTPESDVAPHFLNGRNGVWVRTGEYSATFKPELANDRELCLEVRPLRQERITPASSAGNLPGTRDPFRFVV